MRPIDIVVILLLVFIILQSIRFYKKTQFRLLDLILWISIAIAVVSVFLFREIIELSGVLLGLTFPGIAIGLLVIYLVVFLMYFRIIELHKKIVTLTRAQALIKYNIDETSKSDGQYFHENVLKTHNSQDLNQEEIQ